MLQTTHTCPSCTNLYSTKGFGVDDNLQTALYNDKSVKLSPLEFDLFKVLLNSFPNSESLTECYFSLFPETGDYDTSFDSIRARITALRKKLSKLELHIPHNNRNSNSEKDGFYRLSIFNPFVGDNLNLIKKSGVSYQVRNRCFICDGDLMNVDGFKVDSQNNLITRKGIAVYFPRDEINLISLIGELSGGADAEIPKKKLFNSYCLKNDLFGESEDVVKRRLTYQLSRLRIPLSSLGISISRRGMDINVTLSDEY